MRVLVAYEEAYRSYRDALIRAIREHRPRFTLLGTTLGGLEEAMERFEPHAVVSSRPSAEYPGGGREWSCLPSRPGAGGSASVGTTRGRRTPAWGGCWAP